MWMLVVLMFTTTKLQSFFKNKYIFLHNIMCLTAFKKKSILLDAFQVGLASRDCRLFELAQWLLTTESSRLSLFMTSCIFVMDCFINN